MRDDVWQRRDREAREWAQLALDTEVRARARAHRGARLLVLAVVVLVGVLLYAQCAHAQDLECPATGEHAAPRRATITHGGESGTWFRGDVSRCLLGYVGELVEVRAQYSLLEERLAVRDDQLAMLREAVALSVEAQERAVGALDEAERRAREAEEDRDAWWRSPILWVVVGVVVTVALEAAAVAAFGAISI